MAEVTSGIRSILNHPLVYRCTQWLVGAERLRRHLAELIEPTPGLRVLDIGCGPADLLAWLPGVDYVGFDSNANYVAAAQSRFGARGCFFLEQLSANTRLDLGHFDRLKPAKAETTVSLRTPETRSNSACKRF